MNFLVIFLALLAIFAAGTQAEECRRTKCHTHSSQNECNGDERVAKWGYCWGVAGKWESCWSKPIIPELTTNTVTATIPIETTTLTVITTIPIETTTTTTTTEKPIVFTCEDSWTMFQRIKGPVCLKTFNERVLEESEAEKKCNAVGAVVSGLENTSEREWILAQFLPILPQNMEVIVVWIGMRKRDECVVNMADPSCIPKETKMFVWTDPTVTGTDGMVWWGSNPDSAGTDPQKMQRCAHFIIQRLPIGITYPSIPATLDDIDCDNNTSIHGYVCSKRATQG